MLFHSEIELAKIDFTVEDDRSDVVDLIEIEISFLGQYMSLPDGVSDV